MTADAMITGSSEQIRCSGLRHRLSIAAERRFEYLLIAPAILVLLAVGLFPLIYSAVVSFQSITMTDVDTSFAGFANYARLFEDRRLWESLLHTAIICAVALPVELVLGFLMAQLFLDRMPGRQVFVALLVLPTVISPIVAGATWRLMFDVRYGPIGEILGFLAGEPVRILWTVNPQFVYPAIVICEVWQWSPFMFLLLLAALSNVDPSQLEAAELDGASWWRTLRQIVLPAIGPVVAVAVLIRGLDLVRIFDIIWALTEGGPGTMSETISLYTYSQGFSQFETSYTAAIAFLVIVILSVIVTIALKRVEMVR
jgi:multiple sugar transport system permease protein